jgi:hypothetical protein
MIEWNGWYKVKDCTAHGCTEDFLCLVESLGHPSTTGRWFYEYDSRIYYFRNKNDALMYEIGWANATAT